MKYNQLGDSKLRVSEIGLGTMTFGSQNSLAESHLQLDRAAAAGVNLIDAAEAYPVPMRQEWQGQTESFIGQWLARQDRSRFVIATKIAGPGAHAWLRGGPTAVDGPNIRAAVDASLKRLRSDYIDLYQIHWPDRYVPRFGESAFEPARERPTVAIAEQLSVFDELIRAGKIRYLGVSNETPWGIAAFAAAARASDLPHVVSIQNAYSLINRVFDLHLAEAVHRERVGLLAYSALAFGHLTGKYLDGAAPPSTRATLFPGFDARYRKPNVDEAVRAYRDLARKHGLSPAALALAFVRGRWFVASTLIGATTIAQLEENLASADVVLTPEILAEIDAISARYPSPAP
jgi:aryl-alcohol dehydrogenase-like predicted oxidoreductase